MKNKKWITYGLAVLVSLCVICVVAALAIETSDTRTRAQKYAEEYDGSLQVYEEIFSLTDCSALQKHFDTAYANNQASQPGTIYSKRAIGFMTAADERMREIGCYE